MAFSTVSSPSSTNKPINLHISPRAALCVEANNFIVSSNESEEFPPGLQSSETIWIMGVQSSAHCLATLSGFMFAHFELCSPRNSSSLEAEYMNSQLEPKLNIMELSDKLANREILVPASAFTGKLILPPFVLKNAYVTLRNVSPGPATASL